MNGMDQMELRSGKTFGNTVVEFRNVDRNVLRATVAAVLVGIQCVGYIDADQADMVPMLQCCATIVV